MEGLPCKTFHDVYAYEWAQKLRDKASIIQDEFRRVAIQGSDDLDKKGNNVWATAANATSAQSYGVCVCNIHTYLGGLLPRGRLWISRSRGRGGRQHQALFGYGSGAFEYCRKKDSV